MKNEHEACSAHSDRPVGPPRDDNTAVVLTTPMQADEIATIQCDERSTLESCPAQEVLVGDATIREVIVENRDHVVTQSPKMFCSTRREVLVGVEPMRRHSRSERRGFVLKNFW